jgi:NitT/TauT family transport system ATP-binding protein
MTAAVRSQSTSRAADHQQPAPSAGGRPPKVRVDAVEKAFVPRGSAPVQALGGVDLVVRAGEFISVVGPSGCGKSTLLRLVANLDRPSAGRIEIQRESDVGSATAVVFQEYSIFPWKSVEANIAFGLRMRGESRAAALEQARVWIGKVGLTGFERALPATLSGGMKQRVAIARAFALDPEVLLLDEPFAALDAQLREVLQEELLDQWQRESGANRSAILVTHSLDESILLGDRVVLMSARPGIVKEEFDVPFARPRTPALRATEEFGALRDRIWASLREEVDRTARGETTA